MESRNALGRRAGHVASVVALGAFALAGALVSADEAVQARVVEVHADTVKLGRGTAAGVREKQIYDIFGDTPQAWAIPQPPRVHGFSPLPKTPAATTNWRARINLKVDVDVEPGRHVYYEWNSDGGALVHGVEVGPGVFRTTVPENAWVAPMDKREVPGKPDAGFYGVSVKIMDSSAKFALQSFRLQSSGAENAHPEQVRWKRTFAAKGPLSQVRDVAFDRANHAFVLDVKSGTFSDDLFVRELDADGRELGSAKCDSNKYSAIAVSETALFFLDLKDRTVKRWQRTADVASLFAAQAISIGEKGSGNGRLSEPVDLALCPDGAVLVLDKDQKCVQRYEDGRFAYSFGKPGEAEHELKSPVAFSVSEDGAVYVLDDGRKKIVVYRNGRTEGADIDVGVPGEDLRGIAVDNFTGMIHVLATSVKDEAAGKKIDTVKHFNKQGDPLPKTALQSWNDLAALSKPVRMRIDGARVLYVVDKEGASLCRFDGANEGRGFPFLARTGGVKMSRDVRLGVSSEGSVVVLDRDAPAVLRFDQSGWATSRFGGEASGAGQLKKPVGVAVDDEGNIFVADAKKVELNRYQPSGNHQWAKGGERVYQEIRDCQITGRRERVAVLQDRDDHARLVALVTPTGEVEAAVPANPTDEISSPVLATLAGPLEPNANTKGEETSYWIVDKGGKRLNRFKLGAATSQPIDHDFKEISAISASIANVVFVCDKGHKLVAVFAGTGRALTEITDPEHCEEPIDLGLDDFGRLYVFDKSNDGRIVVFGGD
ncbi:hypothetical protein HY251_10530 [bacterium]|nr:hypothetical protein [bacterium]